MNILLTNDDGYNARGILLLKRLLSKYGNVVIVAPKTPMSAKSASLTIGRGLKVVEEDKDIFSIDGTPVDCVSFGLTSLSTQFDLVVSGCNDGWNISYDSIYSGTIGACLESLMLRVPSIAFSTEHNFDLVEKHFDKVMKYILENKLISKEYLLNINFPLDDVKDVSLAKEYYRKDTNFFTKKGDGYWAYRYLQDDFSDQKDSDCYLVHHNTVAIVPLNKTYYSHEIYNVLKDKIK